VRESCYPFYEPCYTEFSNGCSQEVQSFKRWKKDIAIKILRTEKRRREEALEAELRQFAQIVASRRQEIIRASQRRTQILFAEVEQSFLRQQKRRTEECWRPSPCSS